MANRNTRNDDELGPEAAGQAGDLQQIPNDEDVTSESVEELIEEGNAFEAEIVYGVENAKPPDISEVKTREVPEDNVPEEYLNDDNRDVA
jgi:hypothetical protein